MTKALNNGVSCIAIKLDMTKAYDRLNWNLIQKVLYYSHFPDKFKDVIMRCTITSTIAFRFNGYTSQFFKPAHGLHQGYLISPLFFNLCTMHFQSTSIESVKRVDGKIYVLAINTYIYLIWYLQMILLYLERLPCLI